MTIKTRWDQWCSAATLLRGAALAMALMAQASLARAETVTLTCQDTSRGAFSLRVDYDQKTVAMLNASGSAYLSAPADITDAQVFWDVRVEKYAGYRFNGSVNRMSGEAWLQFPGDNGGGQLAMFVMSGPCSRAAQKF